MKKKLKSILAAALSAVGFAAVAEPSVPQIAPEKICDGANTVIPQVITYRGVLASKKPFEFQDGKAVLKLTFSLYDGASTAPVWARTIPVTVATNGAFYTELKDDAGILPQGVAYSKLADELSKMKGVPELGLTPPDSTEIKPRQKLTMGVRAARAVKSRAADVVNGRNGLAFDGVRVCELSADMLTVSNLTVVGNGKCTFSRAEDRTVGGGNATVAVGGVCPSDDAAAVDSAYQGAYTTEDAPCDMAITYQSEKHGAFSVILPKGGKISGSSAAVKSMTRFANKMN